MHLHAAERFQQARLAGQSAMSAHLWRQHGTQRPNVMRVDCRHISVHRALQLLVLVARHVGASAQRSAPGLPGAAAAAAAVAAAPASGAAAGRLDTSHRCKVWQRFSSAAIDQLAAWQVEQRQAAAAAASPLAGEALTAVGVSSPGKQLPQRWGVPQPAAHRHIARCRSARRRTQPSRRDRSAADCLSHIGDLQTTSCAVGNLCQERESGPACRRQGMLVRGSDE